MQTFKSKYDAWLIALIYSSSLICIVASVYVLFEGLSSTNIITAIFISVIGGFVPIWLVVSLRYIVDDTSLKIICGPVKWNVELSSIQSVSPSRNIISSPALSLDRLLIVYGSGKTVLVSPSDKESFISALRVNR